MFSVTSLKKYCSRFYIIETILQAMSWNQFDLLRVNILQVNNTIRIDT